MTLKSPFLISPRLLPALRVGGAFIQLEIAQRRNAEGRTVFRWRIDLPDGKEFSGADLRSGCGGGSLQSGFESLLSFLSAFAESGEEGENADLFPVGLREWADLNSSELSMLQCEISEGGKFIS